jgi:hypothetical protein
VSYFEPGHGLGDDDPPLSSEGSAQAEALGRLLEEAPIDFAACSGLQRTRQTAELATGSRALDVVTIEGLSEAKPGAFEDIETAEEMEATFVRAFENAEEPGARFLTGETYAAVWARVAAAWQAFLARDDWSHAYRRLEQDTGCLNILDIEGRGIEARVAYVRLVNFTPYNAVKVGMHETTLEMLWRQFLDA